MIKRPILVLSVPYYLSTPNYFYIASAPATKSQADQLVGLPYLKILNIAENVGMLSFPLSTLFPPCPIPPPNNFEVWKESQMAKLRRPTNSQWKTTKGVRTTAQMDSPP